MGVRGEDQINSDMDKLRKVAEALSRNGFKAIYAENREEAARIILESISPTESVGVGGSSTIRELGLIEKLVERGNKVIHHWKKGMSKEEVLEALRGEINSDVFLTSSNAVTMDGKLVNKDMIGNRVAAMIFGPKRVFVVVGVNKIVEDVKEALERIERVAAPLNAKRLGVKTPCVETGYCTDCDSPDRICRVTTIIERRPSRTDLTVVLVNENLGY